MAGKLGSAATLVRERPKLALALVATASAAAVALWMSRPSAATMPPPPPVTETELPPPVDLSRAKLIGRFRLRHYWIHEHDDAGEDARRRFPIFDPDCRVIARVPGKVRRQMRREGTARLADGRLINLWGRCRCGAFPCFTEVERTRPWGLGVRGHHLSPFRSIAVDPRFVRIGTRVYVEELDGLRMPGEPPLGGYVHDGCVTAADRGRGIRGNKIDFFVADREHFLALARHRLRRVHLYRGVERCLEREPSWTPEKLEAFYGVVDGFQKLGDTLLDPPLVD